MIRRTLQELGVLAAGQAPAAEDAAIVNAEIEPLLSDLSVRGIYPYADPDQIEDEAFIHLAILLALSTEVSFGKERPKDEKVVLKRSAENDLRVLYRETLSYQPARADYF